MVFEVEVSDIFYCVRLYTGRSLPCASRYCFLRRSYSFLFRRLHTHRDISDISFLSRRRDSHHLERVCRKSSDFSSHSLFRAAPLPGSTFQFPARQRTFDPRPISNKIVALLPPSSVLPADHLPGCSSIGPDASRYRVRTHSELLGTTQGIVEFELPCPERGNQTLVLYPLANGRPSN
jgi:hypothetical protein